MLISNLSYTHTGVPIGILDTEVLVGTTEHFTGTKVPIGATQIPYTEVLVGTT